jgi:hypothetical protein
MCRKGGSLVTNKQKRAGKYVWKILSRTRYMDGRPYEEAAIDLITDTLHFATCHDLDPAMVLRCAISHYNAECGSGSRIECDGSQHIVCPRETPPGNR